MKESDRISRNEAMFLEIFSGVRDRFKKTVSMVEDEGFRPRIQCAWRSIEKQIELFKAGRSKLKYGFHNVTGVNGAPEALAADVLDDDSPLDSRLQYLLCLAWAAERSGLITGISWGLPAMYVRRIELAVMNKNFSSPVSRGWDPTHVQVTGITVQQAKEGHRPRP